MDAQRSQVDANYDYFERNLKRFLAAHQGQYVLLRDRAEVAFFDRGIDTYRAGLERFGDGIFSVQEVTDRPLDLGFMSVAGH